MENQMALAPLGLSQSMDSVNTASNEEEVSDSFHSAIPKDKRNKKLQIKIALGGQKRKGSGPSSEMRQK